MIRQDFAPLAFGAAFAAAFAAAVAVLSRGARDRAPGLEGMGVSIRSLGHTDLLPGATGYDGAALAAWCVANNVRYVEIQAAWIQNNGSSPNYLGDAAGTRRVGNELRAAGIKIGVWGYPNPVNDQEYRDRMVRGYELLGAEWFKHDPEAPYQAAGHSDRYGRVKHSLQAREDSAAEIMEWSTAMAPVDVTSYGSGPRFHPHFTWEPWSQGARYGRPQWYDRDSDWTDDYVERSAASWRRYFPTLCPILSGVDTNTPQQMREEADQFLPIAAGPSFSYWDFYWLAISQARTDAAREIGAKFSRGA